MYICEIHYERLLRKHCATTFTNAFTTTFTRTPLQTPSFRAPALQRVPALAIHATPFNAWPPRVNDVFAKRFVKVLVKVKIQKLYIYIYKYINIGI